MIRTLAQATLPDAGLDPAGHVSHMVQTVGMHLAIVIGGALALWLGVYAARKIVYWFDGEVRKYNDKKYGQDNW